MPFVVCRTCLTVLGENSCTFFTLENRVPGITTFREKLNCCIPELALDIIPNAVICTKCSTILNLAYDFKTKCLETETKVRQYIQAHGEEYEMNHIVCLNSEQWLAGFSPFAACKLQNDNKYRTKVSVSASCDSSSVTDNRMDSDTENTRSPTTVKEEHNFVAASNLTIVNPVRVKLEPTRNENQPDENYNEQLTLTSKDCNLRINADCLCKTKEDLRIADTNLFTQINETCVDEESKPANLIFSAHQNLHSNRLQVRRSEELISGIGENIKAGSGINEVSTVDQPAEIREKFVYDPQNYLNYFAKVFQKFRLRNFNKPFTYQQAFEQLNMLKLVRSLANQGTEININNSSVHQAKIQCETANDLPKNPAHSFLLHLQDYDKQCQSSSKQRRVVYERYDCYYCDRSFDRLSLLKTHTISHTGVKPFTCNVCGKGCSHKGELNNHIRTHTGEKPFKCSLCEASFSQISNMKIHMRTHTGEKPYKCDYCEKTFSHKCGVKVHMRTHTGERPYRCKVCSKTYTHKKDLDDHTRTHTGEKYKCTICSKEITYKKNLSAHMITHSGRNSAIGLFRKNHGIKYPHRLSY